MADIYSELATAQAATSIRNLGKGLDLTGRVRYARCRYTTTGTTAAADVLYLCKLPQGARVVPGLSFIETEDCGTDVSIKIGDDDATADDDRYTTAASLATAGRVAFTPQAASLGNSHALEQESWIKGVIVDAGSISVTTAKDFEVWLAYILP